MAKAKLGDIIRTYVKPSMDGAVIIRKRGVIRKSKKVLERNRLFAEAKIAKGCKGVAKKHGWKGFVACLREQARAKGLTTKPVTALEGED